MKWKVFFSVLLCAVLLCGCTDGSTPDYKQQSGNPTDENIYNLYDFYSLFQDGSPHDSGESLTLFGIIQEKDDLYSNSIIFNIGLLFGHQDKKDRVVCIFGSLHDLDGVSVNDIVIINGKLDSFSTELVTLKNCSLIAVDHTSYGTLPERNEIPSESEFSSQQSEPEQSSSLEFSENETSSSSSVKSSSIPESSSVPASSSKAPSSSKSSSSSKAASSSKPNSSSVPDKSPSSSSIPTENPTTGTYVLNTSTKKFHRPDCSSVKKIKPENYGTCDSRESAIAQGYSPCKICNP